MDTSSPDLPTPAEILSWITERNDGALGSLFLRMGSGRPNLTWRPNDSTIEVEELRRLNQYWCGLSEGLVPPRSAFFPEDVSYVLGHLNLVDEEVEAGALRYRLFGTLIAERYGKDLTGEPVPEAPPTLGRFFTAAYRAVLASGEPLYTRHSPPPDSVVKDCQRLILPFADAQGINRHLVVAHLPYRPPSGSVARPAPIATPRVRSNPRDRTAPGPPPQAT